MKTLRLNLVVAMAVMAAAQVWGQSAAKVDAHPTAVKAQAPATTATKRVIVVSLEDRKLALVEDGHVKKVYSVAVGKPSTPSPTGTFSIERRVKNPTYRHDGRTVLPGPGNPVGTRWMGLSIHGYGIHGTNEPKSIGKAASHGCIRMAKADLEEFYEMVAEGDTVELVGERNVETARLFGNGQELGAPVVQPALVASATAAAPVAAQGTAQDAGSAEKAHLATAAVTAFTAMR